MNRSTFNKSVVPGLFAFMIMGYSPDTGKQFDQLVSTRGSRRAYEEAAYAGGLGIFPHKPEGEAITYDEILQGPIDKIRLLKSNFKVIKRAISGNPLAEGNSEERLLCIMN